MWNGNPSQIWFLILFPTTPNVFLWLQTRYLFSNSSSLALFGKFFEFSSYCSLCLKALLHVTFATYQWSLWWFGCKNDPFIYAPCNITLKILLLQGGVYVFSSSWIQTGFQTCSGQQNEQCEAWLFWALHSLKSFHSPDLLEPCRDLRKSPGWSAGRW